MQIFNLIDLSIMGEEHPEYGFTYWGETEDSRYVRFSKKDGTLVAPLTISAEKAVPKSGKKDYLQLTGVKASEKTQDTQSTIEETKTAESEPTAVSDPILAELKKQTALLKRMAGEED